MITTYTTPLPHTLPHHYYVCVNTFTTLIQKYAKTKKSFYSFLHFYANPKTCGNVVNQAIKQAGNRCGITTKNLWERKCSEVLP
jgi:hypothetical protein